MNRNLKGKKMMMKKNYYRNIIKKLLKLITSLTNLYTYIKKANQKGLNKAGAD